MCPECRTEVACDESVLNSFDPLPRVRVQPRQDGHWSWAKRFLPVPTRQVEGGVRRLSLVMLRYRDLVRDFL